MNQEQDLRSEQALEELLSRAQPRPLPPQEDEQLIRQAVHAEWDKVLTRRSRTRRRTYFAFAASVLLAVLVALNGLRGPYIGSGFQQVASIEKQFGLIKVPGNGNAISGNPEVLEIGSGQSAETGDESGLTLAWNDGGSLRLDQNTRVEFESESEIYLQSGRIYFDSMPSGIPSVLTEPDKARLTIRTDAGTVRHFGTQFITQTDGYELGVLVREGSVTVESVNVEETATAGQKLAVTRDGRMSVHRVDVSGGDWEWIERTSPSFTLDNRPIIEFLTWVSRESGRPLRFASANAEKMVETTELRGVVDMEPSRALRTYMQTTALQWRIEEGVIVIGDSDPNNRPGGT
jgi:ferric-dicitrate binding protein FerR (iron transport regulator)